MTQITIDRALVEQALKALENLQPIIGNGLLNKIQLAFIDPNLDVAITALRAALAQQAAAPETCTWHQDGDSDSGLYATSCRYYFNLEDGTPEDNKMQWCCYCGKKLAQELIAENSDD